MRRGGRVRSAARLPRSGPRGYFLFTTTTVALTALRNARAGSCRRADGGSTSAIGVAADSWLVVPLPGGGRATAEGHACVTRGGECRVGRTAFHLKGNKTTIKIVFLVEMSTFQVHGWGSH